MSHLTFRDATAIVQLILFVVYLASGIFLCHKHRRRRSGGWSIIVIFSLLRIIGASFQLATIFFPTRSEYAGALVTESIGIAPPIGTSAAMLARLLTGVGVASASASVPTPPNSPSPFVANHLTKVADVIFTVEFFVYGLLFAFSRDLRFNILVGSTLIYSLRSLYCMVAMGNSICMRYLRRIMKARFQLTKQAKSNKTITSHSGG
ncbi:hypothetical protein F5Y09DRAFT_329958 [Xylaria sp. FL1042]|nr:hypothetical protein F5Y09DRAFT_329958 [Xylaria sp. FL1042]